MTPFHIKPSRTACRIMMHRVMAAGVMNLSFLVCFFPGTPSLVRPQHFNRGPFLTPTCTCDQPALPASEAIKSKRERAVRTAFISTGRPLALHFSRARRRARLVALAVAGNLKTIKMSLDFLLHLLHSSSRTPPIWPL